MPEMIRLGKERIDQIFEEAAHQHDAWLALYEVALPAYDLIEKIDGYPEVSTATNEYLFEKFIAFDQQHHREVMAGGLWLNLGFAEAKLPDWWIDIGNVTVHWKDNRKEVS